MKEGRIVDLQTNIAPIKYELFSWWILSPVEFSGDRFHCSQLSVPETSGLGAFTLEGRFTSENKCEGVMKWPAGFFWIDFKMPRDVIVQWTAAKK